MSRHHITPTTRLSLRSDKAGPAPAAIQTPVRLSFEYVADPGTHYCLSGYQRDEIKAVVDCLRKLTTMSWLQVRQTGGRRGTKQGLGFTEYADTALRGVTRPTRLSQDRKIFGVRSSEKARVFGAYAAHMVYILWFDRNHEIVPD
jgi:hypothetical protein